MQCAFGIFNFNPRDKLSYRFYWYIMYCTSFLKKNDANFFVF